MIFINNWSRECGLNNFRLCLELVQNFSPVDFSLVWFLKKGESFLNYN